MSFRRSGGRGSVVLGWLLGALLLVSLAAIAGLAAAQIVSTGQAVPTVDPSLLVTATPRPTAAPAVSATPAGPTASPTARPTRAPSAEPTASATSAATPRTHVVVRGETLSIIAARYGTTVEAIVALNNLPNANRIQAGQILLIPPP